MTRPRALGRVTVVGRGKVGRALARAAAESGVEVDWVASRPRLRVRASDLFVLAVADGAAREVGSALEASGVAPSAVVHTAGILAPDHLAAMRARGWSVGQAHPLVAFAGAREPLPAGATVLVGGDRVAVARARALVRAVGLRPLVAPGVDRQAWHAVAALVANGAAALAAVGVTRLRAEGIEERVAARALGVLLASVASNVSSLGPIRALSGPVRRGDPGAVGRHLAALAGGSSPGARPGSAVGGGADALYATLALAQVPLARHIGEARPGSLRDIEALARAAVAASALTRARDRRRG